MHWIPAILVLPYFFILMRIWRSLHKIKQYDNFSNTSAFVSIIVPCRNEEPHLPFLLGDIARQDFPPESYEVIVVDDNSSDKTYDFAVNFRGIKNLSIIKNSGTGKKSAIRTGISVSSGELIITTDADCRIKEKWLGTIASFSGEYKPDMLICPVQLKNRAGFFGRFQELEFLSLQGVTAGCAISGNATMCNGANLSFSRESYLKHTDNLHDEISSGDDVFFLHSLKEESVSKIMWLESKEATVTASSSDSIKGFIKQRIRWISKGKAYSDNFTIILAIVTFVTNILIISLLSATLINIFYLKVLIVAFLVKSIPDFLIMFNTSCRYGRKSLMKWFLQSEVIYPFYILGVAILSIFHSGEQAVNYPFRKGI